MSLQFTSLNDLKTDLESKNGISSVGNLTNSDIEFDTFGKKYHQIEVERSHTDSGGDIHTLSGLQDIVEQDDGSWGYGNNRLWNTPSNPNTFSDDFKAHVDSFEGTDVGGKTLLKVKITRIESDRQTGTVEGVFSDGSKQEGFIWKDENGDWNEKLVS